MELIASRCEARSSLVKKLFDLWKSDHEREMASYNVEELIDECLSVSMLLSKAWAKSLDLLFAEEVNDFLRLRDVMLASVRQTGESLRAAVGLAQALSADGRPTPLAAELTGQVEAMAAIEHEIETKWPSFDAQMASASTASRLRGECESVEGLINEAKRQGAA